jgi:hypothetical protein
MKEVYAALWWVPSEHRPSAREAEEDRLATRSMESIADPRTRLQSPSIPPEQFTVLPLGLTAHGESKSVRSGPVERRVMGHPRIKTLDQATGMAEERLGLVVGVRRMDGEGHRSSRGQLLGAEATNGCGASFIHSSSRDPYSNLPGATRLTGSPPSTLDGLVRRRLWAPVMFDRNWSLLVGEGEMGGFVRDWLAQRKEQDQPVRH